MPIDKPALKELKVDAVLCISLADRDDRRRLLLEEFRETGLNIEFYLATRDKDPERGCYHSHQACAFLAAGRGWRNVLILEDDATLERVTKRQVRRINRFLKDEEPELFYLGVILGKLWLTRRRGIARCRAKGAHAYILTREACEKLIAIPYIGEPIDVLYLRRFKGHCAFPMMCQQRPGTEVSSDIASFRKDDPGTDVESWRHNWRKQYTEALRNVLKTLAGKE